MIIHTFIRFCMVLNPYICQELEIAPIDHPTLTKDECMHGVMRGDTTEFLYQGARWRIAGGACRFVEANLSEIQAQLKASVNP